MANLRKLKSCLSEEFTHTGGTINTIENMLAQMPAPKTKKKKKKKKAEAADDEPPESPEPGSPDAPAKKKKKKKKGKKKKSDIPEVPPLTYGPLQTTDQATNNTISWYQNNNIGKKLSVGVPATARHD